VLILFSEALAEGYEIKPTPWLLIRQEPMPEVTSIM
jgi:hypothetical protein